MNAGNAKLRSEKPKNLKVINNIEFIKKQADACFLY